MFSQIIKPTMVLLLLNLFLLPQIANCQQKITIKDQDNLQLGHFIVETYHIAGDGSPALLPGSLPEIISESNVNNFIIKVSNLIWYDPEIKKTIDFDIDKINVNEGSSVSFKEQGQKLTLSPAGANEVNINITTEKHHLYKFTVPFLQDINQGRFLLSLSVLANQPTNSKGIKEEWSAVDMNDRNQVENFISKYESVKLAKKYVKAANRQLVKLNAIANMKAEEESFRSVDELEEDVRKIVPTEEVEVVEVPELKEKDRQLQITVGNQMYNKELSQTEFPLQFRFFRKGQSELDLKDIVGGIEFESTQNYEINAKTLNGYDMEGVFSKMEVFNAYNENLLSVELNDLDATQKSFSGLLIAGILGLLAAIGAFVFFNGRKHKKKKEALKAKVADKISAHHENLKKVTSLTEEPVAVQDKVRVQKQKIKLNKPGSKQTSFKKPIESTAKSPIKTPPGSKIKIVSRKKKSVSIHEDKFNEILTKHDTVKINLRDIWKDSAVYDVYMTRRFVQELDEFLADSSSQGIENELQGAIPEVGGFLMGRWLKKNNDIQLAIEKFVPFVPEYNDVFKIEIGTKTLVDELGDAQDKFKELDVVGWFHTHPGHGLFLSMSDLAVHRHFPKPFQVAMEIDSLTPNLDMSMFTRKMDGSINNTQDRKPNTSWFKWTDIDNSLS